MEHFNFFAKVHLVAGKGGVGKTLIAQALATLLARNNKTLLVELCEEESKEKRPEQAVAVEVAPNLFRMKIYPDQALYEYLCVKIPSRRVLDMLLTQNLFRAMCSAMPGLSDLTRLGKIWFHADEQHGSSEIYQKIVVDMPSSGFVARFLSIASVVEKVVKIGPLAKDAGLIREYFSNENNVRLHLVTLPLEMSVNETIELYQQVAKANVVSWGVLFVNRILKPAVLQNLPSLVDLKAFPTLHTMVQSFSGRMAEESSQRARFSAHNIMLPQIVIADQVGEKLESAIVNEMVNAISAGGL